MTGRIVVAALGICLPLLSAVPTQGIEAVTTDRVEFASGGAIRIDASGELNVEGWDQPAVEITLTRTLFRPGTPKEREEAKARLDGIRIVTEKNGEGELVISTKARSRKLFTTFRGKTEVNLDYRIKVPHDSRLFIRNDIGDVVIYGVGGNIDASDRIGSIVLQLPEQGSYSIDAKSRMGGVNSDFTGNYHHPYLLGQSYVEAPKAPGHKVRLRVGIGGIEIQRTAPTPPIAAPVRSE
jgi:hypothetical protein